MICQRCGKNESTIHLTEIVNGQMLEVHICEQCAKEKGADVTPLVPFNEILSGLVQFTSDKEEQPQKSITCSKCGLTWEQFKTAGRLGCAQCYSAFSEYLMPLIKKVHGAVHHMGKCPSRLSNKLKIEIDLKDLSEKLRRHIELEEYEEAAQVRDKIRSMERKLVRQKKKKEQS